MPDIQIFPLIMGKGPVNQGNTEVGAMAFSKSREKNFPKNFVWGVATSAYQTEGAWNLHGKGPSVWDTFTQSLRFKNGNGNTATDFYHRYKEDIKSIHELNLSAFRFSISWSRIFPAGIGEPNAQGVKFYHKVIDYCLKKDIEPWITLYHWDLPQALEDRGGWTNREILEWFSTYVNFCTREYGSKVKKWMVLNEPMSFVGLGYFMGIHAPGRRGLRNFLPAAHHATLCQAIGGRIVRENVKGAYVGTTFSCSVVKPKNLLSRHRQAARRMDALLNRFFLEPLLGLGYPIDVIPGLSRIRSCMKPGDEELMQFDFDFIGIQYYFRIVAQFSLYPPILFANEISAGRRKVETSLLGMEIYPKGLKKMLKKYSKYSGLKDIYITESGMCYNDQLVEEGIIPDEYRINYYRKTLKICRRAIKKGIKLKGLFFWTLVDNFEWADGTKPRFGLIYNDFQTQKRTLKKSAEWVREMLRRGKV